MLCIDQKNKSKNATNDFNLLEKQNLKGDKHDLHLMRYREIVILVCMEGKKINCVAFFSVWIKTSLETFTNCVMHLN